MSGGATTSYQRHEIQTALLDPYSTCKQRVSYILVPLRILRFFLTLVAREREFELCVYSVVQEYCNHKLVKNSVLHGCVVTILDEDIHTNRTFVYTSISIQIRYTILSMIL